MRRSPEFKIFSERASLTLERQPFHLTESLQSPGRLCRTYLLPKFSVEKANNMLADLCIEGSTISIISGLGAQPLYHPSLHAHLIGIRLLPSRDSKMGRQIYTPHALTSLLLPVQPRAHGRTRLNTPLRPPRSKGAVIMAVWQQGI